MRTNLIVAAVIVAFAGGAQAGILGDTVAGNYVFPNPGNSVQNFGAATVGAGVEFTNVQYYAQADFSDTQLILSFNVNGAWGAVAQSGPAFTDQTNAFTSFSIDGATTAGWFTAGMVSLDNTGVLLINWSGQVFTTADTIVLDLGTGAIPEPMSMVLLGTGLAGLGVARRRRG